MHFLHLDFRSHISIYWEWKSMISKQNGYLSQPKVSKYDEPGWISISVRWSLVVVGVILSMKTFGYIKRTWLACCGRSNKKWTNWSAFGCTSQHITSQSQSTTFHTEIRHFLIRQNVLPHVTGPFDYPDAAYRYGWAPRDCCPFRHHKCVRGQPNETIGYSVDKELCVRHLKHCGFRKPLGGVFNCMFPKECCVYPVTNIHFLLTCPL